MYFIMNFCKGMIVCGMLLYAIVMLAPAAHAATNGLASYKYVINLASSNKPIDSRRYQAAALSPNVRVYPVKLSTSSRYEYRVRLGFFNSRRAASAYLEKLSGTFKGAWLDTIKTEEVAVLKNWLGQSSTATPVARTFGKLSEEKLNTLMEEARVAMVIYTKVLQSGANVYQKEAQEYLGLARERNGQLAHARAEYRIYLARYPTGEDAERVRQRLDALVSANRQPVASLPSFKPRREGSDWQFYGSLLQFYDRDVINTERFGDIVANSIFSTNFNHAGRSTVSRYKMRTDFAATHVYDLQDDETDDQRITSMYFDVVTPGRKLESRMGRQRGRSGGVIGRFDGFDLGYRLSSRYRLKLITGFPYEKNQTVEKETDKYFYSLGLELGPFNNNLDFSVFALQQIADGLVDRQEVGAELRYRTATQSLFSLFDYSTDFSTVNYFMTVYNLRFEDDSSIDVIADYRKSPFLTTSSALQGQVGVSSLGDLLQTLDEDQIAQLSIDRTSLYKSLTLLHRRPLSRNIELNADVSVSNLSGTVSSGGVEGSEGTGNEYSASVGFIGNNLLMENDINIANIRFSRFVTSDVMVLGLSSKYRLGRKWRINPRLRYEQRQYDDGHDVDKIKPSIRLHYRQNRNWEFEFEYDYEDKVTSTPGLADENESSYTVYAGYIYSFQ